jgi:competence ComEA-like helix-hairpin-helix protein
VTILRKRLRGRVGIALVCLVFGLGIAAQEQELPDGKGKETIQTTCAECHGLDKIVDQPRSRGQWESVVNKMRTGGATMTDAEYTNVVDYLVAHFGPEESAKSGEKAEEKINVNKADAKELESALELTSSEAAAIVRYREVHGAFKEWVDLTKADGVDKAKIEAKKGRLSFQE